MMKLSPKPRQGLIESKIPTVWKFGLSQADLYTDSLEKIKKLPLALPTPEGGENDRGRPL
jgi:hypothetical protein